eukprot:2296483-Pyramimonas_sp.AAC.1
MGAHGSAGSAWDRLGALRAPDTLWNAHSQTQEPAPAAHVGRKVWQDYARMIRKCYTLQRMVRVYGGVRTLAL